MGTGEVCYVATAQAILGCSNAHQLEVSQQRNAGLEFKGVKFGESVGTKETYSSIQYDENHPGTLIVSNKRVSFISAPSVLLDIFPGQIVSVAWTGPHVLIRTNISSDDNKNLFAFRLTGTLPSWLFASAIFRLGLGDAVPTRAEQIDAPATS